MKVGYGRYTAIKYDCRDRYVNRIVGAIATVFSHGMIILVCIISGSGQGKSTEMMWNLRLQKKLREGYEHILRKALQRF